MARAKAAPTAQEGTAPAMASPPAADPVLTFGFDVAEFLRRVGVDLAQIEGLARSWAEQHPGQALPLEVAISFVEGELGAAQVAAAVRVVAGRLVTLAQTGKGPVQHAGAELA